VGQVCPAERGIGQVGDSEIRTIEMGAAEVGFAQVSTFEMGAIQIHVESHNSTQVRF
jgi:hypothetical protein